MRFAEMGKSRAEAACYELKKEISELRKSSYDKGITVGGTDCNFNN